jgi:hypothetical protein
VHLKCLCGNYLSDAGHPNETEYLLVSTSSQEKLQDLVDEEVADNAIVDMWPEHWEDSGAAEIWKCCECKRLYFNVLGSIEEVIVYKIEQQGLVNAENS